MSLLADAELAATAGTPWVWLRIAGKLLPWVLLAAALTALSITRETLAGVRSDGKLAAASAQRDAALHDAAQANRTSAAVASYADKAAALQPIVVRSTDTVTRYAQTAAGRASCAAPDRVLGIDQLDATLWPAGAAGGRVATLPADAGAPPAGRLGDQR